MKNIFLTGAIILFSALAAFALKSPDKVDNFTLKDYNGKSHSLTDYNKSKAIVLIFVSTQCPISNDYNSRMAEIHEAYKDKGVMFLGINSNKEENVKDIKSHAGKNKLTFPILKDEKNILADKLSASVTPEVYILNNNFEILYQGRIDDSRNGKNIKSKDLETALNEILAGKGVSNARTKAFGCTIKRIVG